MNLFRLSDDPKETAQFYQDIHVRKIIVESAQILANCYTLKELENAPKTQLGNTRKYSYYNHPICKWVREDLNNYNWVLCHAVALVTEYTYRFDKKHFCADFILWCAINFPNLKNIAPTEHPQCFLKYPELMVKNNPVEGYRNYYKTHKMFFVNKKGKVTNATWTRRDKPIWI